MDHFSVCEHYSEDFSKDQLIESGFEKLTAMTKDELNTFLIQEFERILSEINCPVDYLKDMFIKDISRDDYVLEKYTYRKRKNILLIYRGTLFLLERRFQTFMNVTLFKLIIQECNVENLSNEMILCLIRSGMVLTLREVWKVLFKEEISVETFRDQWKKLNEILLQKPKYIFRIRLGRMVEKLKPRDHLNHHSRWTLRKLKS